MLSDPDIMIFFTELMKNKWKGLLPGYKRKDYKDTWFGKKMRWTFNIMTLINTNKRKKDKDNLILKKKRFLKEKMCQQIANNWAKCLNYIQKWWIIQ